MLLTFQYKISKPKISLHFLQVLLGFLRKMSKTFKLNLNILWICWYHFRHFFFLCFASEYHYCLIFHNFSILAPGLTQTETNVVFISIIFVLSHCKTKNNLEKNVFHFYLKFMLIFILYFYLKVFFNKNVPHQNVHQLLAMWKNLRQQKKIRTKSSGFLSNHYTHTNLYIHILT